tara:strand:+ start:595 stop:813 length:219 start_codon:yes stop_codon:yes gene_type:complete
MQNITEDEKYLINTFKEEDILRDIWDTLMKNTIYKPLDFSKIKEDCLLDLDNKSIELSNFKLSIKRINEDEM